jgi:hypothetical protein
MLDLTCVVWRRPTILGNSTMRKLQEKPWSHDILLDEATETYFMDVICGGSAMYTLRVRLTDEEASSFRADPRALDTLASQIASRPNGFADRTVKP